MTELTKATDKELIAEMERRGLSQPDHIAQIRMADFTMSHPLGCRPKLFECEVHKKLEQYYIDQGSLVAFNPGAYKITIDHNIVHFQKTGDK